MPTAARKMEKTTGYIFAHSVPLLPNMAGSAKPISPGPETQAVWSKVEKTPGSRGTIIMRFNKGSTRLTTRRWREPSMRGRSSKIWPITLKTT